MHNLKNRLKNFYEIFTINISLSHIKKKNVVVDRKLYRKETFK